MDGGVERAPRRQLPLRASQLKKGRAEKSELIAWHELLSSLNPSAQLRGDLEREVITISELATSAELQARTPRKGRVQRSGIREELRRLKKRAQG